MTLHVLNQLPLWIGGDLDDDEAVAVERHLADCPACRAEAERLSTSQAWLREAMDSPFDASDGERLCQRVMAQLPASTQTARRLHLRPAFMAAAALLVAALVWRQHGDPGAPAPMQAPNPGVPAVPTTPAALPRTAALPQPRAHPRPHSHPIPPTQDEPARIEFQTADPAIRIIWLAQAKPLPGTAPFPEEP